MAPLAALAGGAGFAAALLGAGGSGYAICEGQCSDRLFYVNEQKSVLEEEKNACIDESFLLKQENERCNGAAGAVTALRDELIFYQEEAEASLQSRVRWELAANASQSLLNSCEQERVDVDSKLNVCRHQLRGLEIEHNSTCQLAEDARQLSELTDCYYSLQESREILRSVQDARRDDIKRLDSCLARRNVNIYSSGGDYFNGAAESERRRRDSEADEDKEKCGGSSKRREPSFLEALSHCRLPRWGGVAQAERLQQQDGDHGGDQQPHPAGDRGGALARSGQQGSHAQGEGEQQEQQRRRRRPVMIFQFCFLNSFFFSFFLSQSHKEKARLTDARRILREVKLRLEAMKKKGKEETAASPTTTTTERPGGVATGSGPQSAPSLKPDVSFPSPSSTRSTINAANTTTGGASNSSNTSATDTNPSPSTPSLSECSTFVQILFYVGLVHAALYATAVVILGAGSLIHLCRRGVETLRLARNLLKTNEDRMATTYTQLQEELRRRNERGEEQEGAAGTSAKDEQVLLRRRHRQQQQQQQAQPQPQPHHQQEQQQHLRRRQLPVEDASSITTVSTIAGSSIIRPATATVAPRTSSSTLLPPTTTAINMREEAVAALGGNMREGSNSSEVEMEGMMFISDE